MGTPLLSDLVSDGNARVTGLPAPSGSSDAATKAYVDAAVEGLAWKDSARVATVANITLTGPGATIDGVSLAANDRVLVKDQSSALENGLYIFNGSAVAMTRAADGSTFAELEQATLSVEEGTSAGASFRQTAVNGTLGTNPVQFVSFGANTPQATTSVAGKIEIATQGEVDAGTDPDRAMTPATAKAASWLVRKFVQTIGDGSATSFNVDHAFGTRDVAVSVCKTSGNYEEVIVDIQRPSTSRVTIVFAAAPASGAYRVIVIG